MGRQEQARKTRRSTDADDVVVCFWIMLCIVLSRYPCEVMEHAGGLKVQIRLVATETSISMMCWHESSSTFTAQKMNNYR